MSGAVASVIVPCRNAAATVEAALAGALASPLREIEVIAVDDGSTDPTAQVLAGIAARDPRVSVLSSGGRGVSAARNVALDAAKGEFVFFLDADDAVEPDFYPLAVEAMRRDDADYCRVAHDETFIETGRNVAFPLKGDYRFSTPDEIREKYLPCFFGYSLSQVRAWYRGERLGSNREMGGVVFGCFRSSIIRDGGIRFDETVEIFEDAMFTSEYLLRCRRTTCIERVLYHYRLSERGSMLSKLSGPGFFENKLRLLARRNAMDAAHGGKLAHLYEASCVFSLLEILRAAFRMRGCLRKGVATFFRYGGDPAVRNALHSFPLSWRKPFLAAAVAICGIIFPQSKGDKTK